MGIIYKDAFFLYISEPLVNIRTIDLILLSQRNGYNNAEEGMLRVTKS